MVIIVGSRGVRVGSSIDLAGHQLGFSDGYERNGKGRESSKAEKKMKKEKEDKNSG